MTEFGKITMNKDAILNDLLNMDNLAHIITLPPRDDNWIRVQTGLKSLGLQYTVINDEAGTHFYAHYSITAFNAQVCNNLICSLAMLRYSADELASRIQGWN